MPIHPHAGLLLTLEGIDGTGKSTLQSLLADALSTLGWTVRCSREPTDGPEGTALRDAARSQQRLPPARELELLLADRHRHLSDTVWPALARGEAVLLDRYYHSTAAYQGAAGLDPQTLIELNERFAPRPQLVVVLRLDPEQALLRIGSRGEGSDAFERLDNLRRVDAIYAGLSGPSIVQLDASRPPEASLRDILAALRERDLLQPARVNAALSAAPPEGAEASPAAARNAGPILAVLRAALSGSTRLLEVGSGLGLHARLFSRALPQVQWQCSEHPDALQELRREQLRLAPEMPVPIELDAKETNWPSGSFDAVYSANTLHIMGRSELPGLFAGAAKVLASNGQLMIYGPFHRLGQATSAGNAEFDQRLRAENPERGIRDISELDALAAANGLSLAADIPLPAHNALRIWQRA
ncbi:MAG: dTMP kinase [Lysobacterales bacterium]